MGNNIAAVQVSEMDKYEAKRWTIDLSHIMARELSQPALFLRNVFIASFLGLLYAILLDNAFAHIQDNDDDRVTCFLCGIGQLLVNIIFLWVATRLVPSFLAWIQLCLSGLIMGVLVFSVQSTMTNNFQATFSF
jgi:hypothetical protein